jgi:uncharacterized membrane protein
LRSGLQQRFTANGYRGIFSLLVLGSMVLIVLGWRGAEAQFLYSPPPALRTPALGLLVLAFLLMVVSARPSRLRRLVRHPQLTGVALWGLAHLLLNGDSRSLLLFGGMLAWAVAEIFAINRRDGVWIKAEAPAIGADLVNIVVAGIVVGVLVYVHPWIAGVTITGLRPQ